MNIIVQKYGGSSVENKDKLEKICRNIISYKKKKKDLVVVVSAQGKTTDALIHYANSYSSCPDKRNLDLLLMTGEVQTVALLSMMLIDKGYDTVGLTGGQAGIVSDSVFGDAKIKSIYIDPVSNYLKEGKIVIIAGFQAMDKFGHITTLGRGGSDLSAVAIASALKADACEIYSDIDGVFSADPHVIKKAKLLKAISYDEMLEAASSGAKVLHNRSVGVAKQYHIPILVKNSQKEVIGSYVQEDILCTTRSLEEKKEQNKVSFEDNGVKIISKKENLTKVSVIGTMMMSNKELLATIFDCAYEKQVLIHMLSFSELSIQILVDSNIADEFMALLHERLIEKNKSQN